MLSIDISNIKKEKDCTIMTVTLSDNDRNEHNIIDVKFQLNDFDETTNASILEYVNINDFEISYKIKFDLTERFNQFNDGILKADIYKQDNSVNTLFT